MTGSAQLAHKGSPSAMWAATWKCLRHADRRIMPSAVVAVGSCSLAYSAILRAITLARMGAAASRAARASNSSRPIALETASIAAFGMSGIGPQMRQRSLKQLAGVIGEVVPRQMRGLILAAVLTQPDLGDGPDRGFGNPDLRP